MVPAMVPILIFQTHEPPVFLRFRRHRRLDLQRLVISNHLAVLHDVLNAISQPEGLFSLVLCLFFTFFILCVVTSTS